MSCLRHLRERERGSAWFVCCICDWLSILFNPLSKNQWHPVIIWAICTWYYDASFQCPKLTFPRTQGCLANANSIDVVAHLTVMNCWFVKGTDTLELLAMFGCEPHLFNLVYTSSFVSRQLLKMNGKVSPLHLLSHFSLSLPPPPSLPLYYTHWVCVTSECIDFALQMWRYHYT